MYSSRGDSITVTTEPASTTLPACRISTRAAIELRETLGDSPRLASPAYLDTVGAAARRLEEALGTASRSPLSEALRQSTATVEELASDVEARYKLDLE